MAGEQRRKPSMMCLSSLAYAGIESPRRVQVLDCACAGDDDELPAEVAVDSFTLAAFSLFSATGNMFRLFICKKKTDQINKESIFFCSLFVT